MNYRNTSIVLSLFLALLRCVSPLQAQEFTVDQKDVKAAPEISEVHKNQIERRVIEAVIWSQPILGVAQTRSTIRTLGGDYNDLVYLSQQENWKWRVLTPNSQVLYVTGVLVRPTGAQAPDLCLSLPTWVKWARRPVRKTKKRRA